LKRALIIGGTKGIGKALTHELDKRGWVVESVGRKQVDLSWPTKWYKWKKRQLDRFNLVVFSAGHLEPGVWYGKKWLDYIYSYAVNALGPVYFLAHNDSLLTEDCKVIFISSVGARNEGIADICYGMSKAALEKAAKALAANTDWNIKVITFDLVDTDMMKLLPKDTLEGRKPITARQAALRILKEIK